jgi:hypothetical protein
MGSVASKPAAAPYSREHLEQLFDDRPGARRHPLGVSMAFCALWKLLTGERSLVLWRVAERHLVNDAAYSSWRRGHPG